MSVPAYQKFRKADRNQRRRWFTAVNKSSVSFGCRAFLLYLAERSDDTAKPVWGMQVKMAEELGCSVRSIQRYVREAELARLFFVDRCPPRRQSDGRIRRGHTNTYCFNVPAARQKPGPRPGFSRSRQGDTSVASNQSLKRLSKPEPIKNLVFQPPPGDDCTKCEDGVIWLANNSVAQCLHNGFTGLGELL